MDKCVRAAIATVEVCGEGRAEVVSRVVSQAVVDAAEEVGKKVSSMYVTDNGSSFLRGCVPNHVSFPSKTRKRVHPTEKPVGLLRYLTLLLSERGDVVLDPFAGSGSTGQACVELDRQVVLVEKDEQYFAAAVKRLTGLESPGP